MLQVRFHVYLMYVTQPAYGKYVISIIQRHADDAMNTKLVTQKRKNERVS